MRGHSGQLCHQYPVKYMIAKKNYFRSQIHNYSNTVQLFLNWCMYIQNYFSIPNTKYTIPISCFCTCGSVTYDRSVVFLRFPLPIKLTATI